MSNLKSQRSLVVDLCIVGLASIAALALRENFAVDAGQWWAFVPYLCITLAVAGPILVVFQLNRSIWRFSGLSDYVRAVGATVLIVIAAMAIGFVVNRLDGVARSLPVLQGMVTAVGLVGARVLSRVLHHRRRRADRADVVSLPSANDTVLLLGWGSVTELFLRSAAELGNGAVQIAGILTPNERHVGRSVLSTRVLGTPENILEVIAELDVHGIHVGRVVIATPFDRLSDPARRMLLELEQTTDVRLDFFAERLFGTPSATPSRDVDERTAESSVGQALRSADFGISDEEIRHLLGRPYWRLKRTIDAAVALILLIVLLPLTLLVAFIVALDVGLPLLFVQQRPGLRGARFSLYKFRTMGASHSIDGARIPDAGRVSKVGALLRRTRLDELPQLFNILIGDMSFVGPRPLVAREQSADTLVRLLVKPGLTGWAQVRGGREVSVADKTALDLWYVRHASLTLDLKIAAATVPMVLFGERVDRGAVRLAWRELRKLDVRPAMAESRGAPT
jgi:lipopolysaccharide/colanic/teichoic acid biosynthesis glycosyltransferase